MLRTIDDLRGHALRATDGDIGKVKDFLFDDLTWQLRYLVADTGNWLPGRRVLLAPQSLRAPSPDQKVVPVNLTKEAIEKGPGLEQDRPVSRQHEVLLAAYHGWPAYWGEPAVLARPAPERSVLAPRPPVREGAADPHLRSAAEVSGYHIQATDDEIGHVEDFVVETSTWTIRYMVVDTRNWLPGKKVLVAPEWIDRIDWPEKKAFVFLPRAHVERAPEYDPGTLAGSS